MILFRWIFRLIKAVLFGAICGGGGFLGGAIVFGILQIFTGMSKQSTDTLIWLSAGAFALWAVITIIRTGIEDDEDKRMMDSLKKAYEEATGEKYTNVPKWESIGAQPSEKKSSGSYVHTDMYGRTTGFTSTYGNSADHFSEDGYSSSFKIDNDVIHYGTDGYNGRSNILDDDKTITHYDKNNMPDGYSKKNSDGTIDHFDKWGMYKGSSKK